MSRQLSTAPFPDPSAGEAPPHPPDHLLIKFRPSVYCCLWVMLVALHAIHAVAYGNESLVCVTTLADSTMLLSMLKTVRMESTYNASITTMLLITSGFTSIWHSLAVLKALFWSCQSKRFSFLSLHDESDHAVAAGQLKAKALTRPVHKLYASWNGVFGMDSKYYANVRDIREIVEIGSQTYLVYSMSRSEPLRALNSFTAIALVLNCWSTPVGAMIWHRAENKSRYFSLLIGTWLACCFTIVHPMTQYYVYSYDVQRAYWHDLAWTVNNLRQLAQLLLGSWLQVISNRLNVLTLTVAMETLKARMRYLTPRNTHQPRQQMDNRSMKASAIVPLGPHTDTVENLRATTTIPATGSLLVLQNHRKRRVIFLAYGAVVLGLHIHASLLPSFDREHGPRCHFEVRPWFYRSAVCTALELNCHRLTTQGSAVDLEGELAKVDPAYLKVLIFSHCPRLEMPARIQSFANLFGIEVYNSSIAEWSEAAALEIRLHPSLAVLRLILVDGISELPPGLQVPGFPATDIGIISTDLQSLPDDLSAKWPNQMGTFMVELSKLDKVPEIATNAQVSVLSLAANAITGILPLDLFVNHSYMILTLSGNPIDGFPDTREIHGTMNFACGALLIQASNVSEIPGWLLGSAGHISVGSSPVCTLNALTTHLSVDCMPVQSAKSTLFPIEAHAQRRLP
uniref:Uncharacterized protein n=1 Tax=Globisporangium ultimum (strain ATCC 200006 / CBS 805.95 / DAOM BR144) TaxID=431595 RepID=K3WBY7_GLOUD